MIDDYGIICKLCDVTTSMLTLTLISVFHKCERGENTLCDRVEENRTSHKTPLTFTHLIVKKSISQHMGPGATVYCDNAVAILLKCEVECS